MKVTVLDKPVPQPPPAAFRIDLTSDEAAQLVAVLGQGCRLVNGLYDRLDEVGVDMDAYVGTTTNDLLSIRKR